MILLDMASLLERYVASMVLSGSGDALGYYNGQWEFCHSGPMIHKELEELGGLDNIVVQGMSPTTNEKINKMLKFCSKVCFI